MSDSISNEWPASELEPMNKQHEHTEFEQNMDI